MCVLNYTELVFLYHVWTLITDSRCFFSQKNTDTGALTSHMEPSKMRFHVFVHMYLILYILLPAQTSVKKVKMHRA